MKKTIMCTASLLCIVPLYCMKRSNKKNVPDIVCPSNSPKSNRAFDTPGGNGTPKTPVKNFKDLQGRMKNSDSSSRSEEGSGSKK